MGSERDPNWLALLGLFPPRVLLDDPRSPFPIHPSPPPRLLIMFSDDLYPPPIDYMSQSLCVRQPYSLQIIQLVECSPPPPQHKYSPSRISSSSYSDSDSDSVDDDSAYDSSSSSPSLSAASSYCSSAEGSAPPGPPSFDNREPSIDDTYRTRQRRVSLWRDSVHYSKNAAYSGSFCCPCGVECFLTHAFNQYAARPASPSQKRKTPDGDLANNDPIVSIPIPISTSPSIFFVFSTF